MEDLDFRKHFDDLRAQQSMGNALLAGIGAAFIGAVLLGLFSYSTGIHLDQMGFLVGLIVAFSVLFAGKGVEKKFGILGATLAEFGCLLGYYFSAAADSPNPDNLGYFELLAAYKVKDFLYDLPDIFGFYSMNIYFFFNLLVFTSAGYIGYKYGFTNRDQTYLKFYNVEPTE